MTTPIEGSRARSLELQPLHAGPPAPPPQATPPADLHPDRIAAAHVDYGRLAANLAPRVAATTPPAADAVQSRLDAYRDTFRASYSVGSRLVQVAPQFRMVGGFNDARAGYLRGKFDGHAPQVRELYAICARAHAPSPTRCLMGCPTAHEITRVTQALLDAGKLPAGPGDLGARIKTMQWQWGIGIDCTDYVVGAALHAAGKSASSVAIEVKGTRLPRPGIDYFGTCDRNPHLAKVPVTRARAGDVVVLDSPGDVGHRAVVFAHTSCDAARQRELVEAYGAGARDFFAGGPVHAYEVDASWSAGPAGAAFGGVRRDTWFFNESSRTWAQINVRTTPPAGPVFETTPAGPANDVFHGVYRFR